MSEDYFEAGSDMVLTNSFGGTKFMLGKYGYGERVEEFNCAAAEHANSVSPPSGIVAGSVGPTGEFVAPLGDVSESEMKDAFTEQVMALEKGGADVIVIETMTAIEEAVLAVKSAKENTKLPVIATMTFDKGPRGLFTMMGVTPKQAVMELENEGADVVGSNCGNGIDVMVEVAREMREATSGYTLIHSNAGIPVIRKGQVVYPEDPDYMASRFCRMVEMGINIVGGCCGTTPDHIKSVCREVKN
jgi:5-methyltetrahydrofolate--homocysteine methyltransferase